MIKLVIFDLDGTLALSKSSLDDEMLALLESLLTFMKVAVISGGDWSQFQAQIISRLHRDTPLENLSLLPTCGTKFYLYEDGWNKLYIEALTAENKEKITQAFQQIPHPETTTQWGPVLEDRGSQITFSALGQQAPIESKKKWDPDFSKRTAMKEKLERLLPEFSIRLGGTTSIDVTKPGIDKAYGIRKLFQQLGLVREEVLFIGDALFPGGNDAPAKETGVVTIQVRDPEETKRVIETIRACLGKGASTTP